MENFLQMLAELNHLILLIRLSETKISCDEEFFCNLLYEDMTISEHIHTNFVRGVAFYIKNNSHGYGGFL